MLAFASAGFVLLAPVPVPVPVPVPMTVPTRAVMGVFVPFLAVGVLGVRLVPGTRLLVDTAFLRALLLHALVVHGVRRELNALLRPTP